MPFDPLAQMPWRQLPPVTVPAAVIHQVAQCLPDASRPFAPRVAQLLWQRGIQDPGQIGPFLDPSRYTPTSPFAFGEAMTRACDRLAQARDGAEMVGIWGDFDADGLTATAVLWEGLGAVFGDRLTYVIPNRLTQSHGLNYEGIEEMAQQGVSLIVTCDTGSTHAQEIQYARDRGIDTIVTDHHTLPAGADAAPFPAVAVINPRQLPPDHPLASLSGVAVAYKLIEALYAHLHLPDAPESLLDLVAIGLIADLVELRGDCRYLAQRGIEQLQRFQRPGLKHLIQHCRRSGDRPADISYGLGPRINAVSRIYGDASFCVELLTTRDEGRAVYLAQQAELANQRRRSLQQRVLQEATSRLEGLDDTTRVIVLSDPDWSVGILGLVAAQLAQRYGRPALLLQTPPPDADPPLARGSARSIAGLDLYELVRHHTHLLHQFGGHPYALGLTLPADNISLLRATLNREARVVGALGDSALATAPPTADVTLTVEDIGPPLFQAFKQLEPFGMGYAAPTLLIRDVWFTDCWSPKQTDLRGQNTYYPRTTCRVCDESYPTGCSAVWWGHRKSDLPEGRCDVLAELDFDSYRREYRLRLVAIKPSDAPHGVLAEHPRENSPQTLGQEPVEASSLDAAALEQRLAVTPEAIWQELVGIAKYLSRTQESILRGDLAARLHLSDAALTLGLDALIPVGFGVNSVPADGDDELCFRWLHKKAPPDVQQAALYRFLTYLYEERFQYRYGLNSAGLPLENAAHGQALDQVIEMA